MAKKGNVFYSDLILFLEVFSQIDHAIHLSHSMIDRSVKDIRRKLKSGTKAERSDQSKERSGSVRHYP